MKRKLTGWFLFLLMAVFTVTANASLRYCLCNDAVVLGDCLCEQNNSSPQEDQQSVTNEHNVCSCCSSCEQIESNTKFLDKDISFNCDCMVDLLIQLDDFVLTTDNQFDAKIDAKISVALYRTNQDHPTPSVILASGICAPRGSPPLFNRLNVPIYLRDCVYRL
jgi:hypothetical protein